MQASGWLGADKTLDKTRAVSKCPTLFVKKCITATNQQLNKEYFIYQHEFSPTNIFYLKFVPPFIVRSLDSEVFIFPRQNKWTKEENFFVISYDSLTCWRFALSLYFYFAYHNILYYCWHYIYNKGHGWQNLCAPPPTLLFLCMDFVVLHRHFFFYSIFSFLRKNVYTNKIILKILIIFIILIIWCGLVWSAGQHLEWDEAVITSVANNNRTTTKQLPDYRASPDFFLDLLDFMKSEDRQIFDHIKPAHVCK